MKVKMLLAFLVLLSLLSSCTEADKLASGPRTRVTIEGAQFHINGRPTYEGQIWTTSYGGQYPVAGLLMNARLVQGVFDDMNPDTRGQWSYPDTKEWDADGNTLEFLDDMASWREHGLRESVVALWRSAELIKCTILASNIINPNLSLTRWRN